jgi:hypothetical protein
MREEIPIISQSEKSWFWQIMLLIGFFAIVVLFWDTLLIYPIKLLVVVFHELSHGLMAIATGGKIIKIQIDYRIGGYCQSSIPNTLFANIAIASAGYLGSLVWGGIVLLIALRTDKDRWLTGFLGLVVLGISYYVFKTGEMFGIVFCVGFGVFLLLAAVFLRNIFHDYFLKFIGLTSCLYVVIDIKEDLINRSNVGSDADAIAELTGLPSMGIGVAWLVVALIFLWFILKMGLKMPKEA